MKDIILICIVCFMIVGCTRSPESTPEVKSAASSEISKVSMEKAILKNGRVCTYPAGSQIHAQYYENLQKTDVSVNEHSQSVSGDETEDETVQIENGQECDDHTECPAGSACLPDHRSEDGYNVVRICKNMTGLSCTTDLDCPDYEFCSSGKCIMCSMDADCRSGFTCSQNICQPKNVSPSCTSSAQCGRGEICAFGECSSFCSYKDDCGEGRICQRASSVDGICVRVHPEKFSDVDAKPCLSSEDYNSQSVCRTDKTESCRFDEDCANRSQDRRCDVGDGECVECLSDADCHGERPLCSADHQCEECVASANCAEGLKCGRPPKRIGEMSDDRNHCLECVNDSECSPEKPFCNLEGKCQAVQCMKDTDCCFLEVCSGHRCRNHAPGLLARKGIVSGAKSDCCSGGSKWGSDDHIFSGTVVEEMATKQELYHNYIEEQRTMHVGYHEWHICRQHTDCGYIGEDDPSAGSNVFDSWCSPVYHQCVDINQKIPKRSYSNNGFAHGIFNNDYTLCWRDSQCPDGLVCNEYGRCGCTPDSCAEGLECSVRFGCVCNHDSACGSLVCRNSRCACSEDSQCGQGKLCGSDGSCYDANDSGALYEEGLNWFVDYHKRPRDLKKAEQFFVKASDLGLTEAMIRLAEIRFEQNQAEEGIGLLKKASDNQNAEAMYRIGSYYLEHSDGDGIHEQALKYLTKSADLNYGPAMIRLAEIYRNGEKTAEDIQKSQSYIQKYYTYSPGAVRDNLRVDTNAFELRNVE